MRTLEHGRTAETAVAALEADVAALAAMTRDSAGEGERASAAWIAGRLREAGASDVRIEPYRGRGTFAGVHVALALTGLVAGRLPKRLGIPLTLAATAVLEADGSGRRPAPGPTREGANVVARIPAAGPRRGTLVVVAHHDATRTGVTWDERLHRPGAARRNRTRSIPPYLAPAALALLGGRTRLGRAGLGLWLASGLHVALGPTVPGANDNASGVAALLALAARWAAAPLDGVEVVLVAPGSEESGMAGMRAFLAGTRLDPHSTLVLSLDTLGCGEPIVLEAEWAVLKARYRPGDLALADEGARLAGLPVPPRWTIGAWTDAVLARHAGLSAISLLSIGPEGRFTNYHLMSDTPERVDHDCVARCLRLAAGIGEAFAISRGR